MQFFEHFLPFINQIQVYQAVAQGSSQHEFHGDVVNPFGVLVIVGLLGVAPSLDKKISNCIGKPQIDIISGSGKIVLAKGIFKMLEEEFAKIG
jgi:hypothetical protein